MLGLLYLLWIFIIGYYLMLKFTPWFDYATLGSTDTDKPRVPAWMLQLPFAWILGALVVNWANFFICNFTRSISSTLFTMTAAGTAAVWIVLSEYKKENSVFFSNLRRLWQGTGKAEVIYAAITAALAIYISFHTFSESKDALVIAHGVWGDFSAHIPLVQSFFIGGNFPPQYVHFPAGDISYHFLFHFLIATLEYLGFSLQWAFNIPSILSLFGMLLVLYVFSIRLTGIKFVAYLTLLFFVFRSSFAFWDFAQSYTLSQLPFAIIETDFYIGKTPLESWGMWTLNNFANQRHLAFALTALLISLVLIFPLTRDTWISRKNTTTAIWKIEEISRPVFIGIFLGSIAFWNGAVLIAALLILAGFALASVHRSEYIVIAIIAVVLAAIQSRLFIDPSRDAIKMAYHFGFIANEKTAVGVTEYILLAYGILLPIFIASLFYLRKNILIAIAFLFPFVFAFTVKPTADIAVNHKFVIISNLLIGIIVSWAIVSVWRSNNIIKRAIALVLVLLLTITGIVDFASFHNMNDRKVYFAKENPITDWAIKNSPKKSIFLTDVSGINTILYAGRPVYLAWPYYGESAGYDAAGREKEIRKIYGAGTKEDLMKEVQKTPIEYVLINDAVRTSTNYIINETLFDESLPLVFSDPYENTKIYKVVR